MSEARSRRVAPLWLVTAVLGGLIVGCLVFVTWVYVDRTASGDVVDRTEALRADAGNSRATRAALRELSQTFVKEFHTYGPDDLNDDGRLIGFEDRVKPLMTSKFQAAFGKMLPLAEGTVGNFSVRRVAQVEGVGVVSFDQDSAEVLVTGWELAAYPHPEKPEQEIKGDQLPFRFQVSLVKVDGEWRVDNLDSFDDEAPGFADDPPESAQPTAPPTGAPTGEPTEGATDPTTAPSTEPTGEGQQ